MTPQPSSQSERRYPYRARLVVDVCFDATDNAEAFSMQREAANRIDQLVNGRATPGLSGCSGSLPVEERLLYAERPR